MFSPFLRRASILCLLSLLILSSCTDNSVINQPNPSAKGMLICSEGTYGRDDALLSLYNSDSNKTIVDYFGQANAGQKLGATANDIATNGDTAFITVTDSKAVEVIRISTGKSLGRMLLTGKSSPRNIAILNTTLGVISTYDGDGIIYFNPTTLALGLQVTTGPTTEGVAITQTKTFVANSGKGDLRKNDPNAGTISIVENSTGKIVSTIRNVPNVIDIQLSSDKTRLYAYFQNLYNKDSLQGVIEFDIATNTELRRWRMNGSGRLQVTDTDIYVFGIRETSSFKPDHILLIPLALSGLPPIELTLPTSIQSPYGLYVHPTTGNIWVTNAKDYTSNGEVIELNRSTGQIIRTISLGVNPQAMIAF